jgi:hypothetical protein
MTSWGGDLSWCILMLSHLKDISEWDKTGMGAALQNVCILNNCSWPSDCIDGKRCGSGQSKAIET